MLFNSLEFLIFFVVTTLVYFRLPLRGRWYFLLLASCYFYMIFIPIYILILGFTIGVDYIAGMMIEGATGHRRKILLGFSIFANVGVLALFKYLTFINHNLAALSQFLHIRYPFRVFDIILPIGLSFHTFQAMSYTIEVYFGRQKAERHFGLYALYVMFYPQLVAGPIERPQNLLHQFRQKHEFDYGRITDGLKLMLRGFFKKVVVADRLAAIVDNVYGAPQQHHGAALLVATVFFAFQIYADFSGYSDIAIGAAQVLGVRLMSNFRQPYFARDVSEFWSRWHISLSTWFRDYLYIPLGGNRVSRPRWYFNLFLTFLLSGLWHGANWTYVAWGALNGLYLIIGLQTRPAQRRLWRAVGLRPGGGGEAVADGLVTFTLICAAWIFFRANSIGDAFYILRHALHAGDLLHPGALLGASGLAVSASALAVAVAGIVALVSMDWVCERYDAFAVIARQPLWRRWALYYAFGFAVVFLGRFGNQQFIYFQF
jgi:D-alanyl-lipoteichoic acid acyltransferase DltB (MBOAT superfamily)